MPPAVDPRVDAFRAEAEAALARLADRLLPHCRLTLVMRNPESEDGNLIITDDDLEAVAGALLGALKEAAGG